MLKGWFREKLTKSPLLSHFFLTVPLPETDLEEPLLDLDDPEDLAGAELRLILPDLVEPEETFEEPRLKIDFELEPLELGRSKKLLQEVLSSPLVILLDSGG